RDHGHGGSAGDRKLRVVYGAYNLELRRGSKYRLRRDGHAHSSFVIDVDYALRRCGHSREQVPETCMQTSIESRMIEIAPGPDSGTQIPVTIVRGARPGPTLALIAGNHGYEYPPILALQNFRAQVDPGQLSGTILMVHVANMPSF